MAIERPTRLNRNLYLDLDETLIHTRAYGHEDLKRDLWPDESLYFELADGRYYVTALPFLQQLLEEARSIFKGVFILTTATRPYAEIINTSLNMGFKEDEIYARGEYNYWCKQLSNDPTAYFIDNYRWMDNKSITEKIMWLGIHKSTFFHWPVFDSSFRAKEQVSAWEKFKEKIYH